MHIPHRIVVPRALGLVTALVSPATPPVPMIPSILLLHVVLPTRPVMRLLLIVIIPTPTATPSFAVPPIVLRCVAAVAPSRTVTNPPTRRSAARRA